MLKAKDPYLPGEEDKTISMAHKQRDPCVGEGWVNRAGAGVNVKAGIHPGEASPRAPRPGRAGSRGALGDGAFRQKAQAGWAQAGAGFCGAVGWGGGHGWPAIHRPRTGRD